MDREQQTFEELDEETRLEELRLQEYFKQRGYKVKEKRECKTAQSEDVDFEISLNDQHLKVEVKADKQMHRTGNILVEISHKRYYKGRTKGWFNKCKADIICYSDTVGKRGYMLNWKKMKPELLGEYKIIGFNNPHDYRTITHGFLVPIESARQRGYIIEEYIY